jgi:hypothetical protein
MLDSTLSPWPSLFPATAATMQQAEEASSSQSEGDLLAGLTRFKLERALSTRRSLRHIVLLTNAFTSSNLSSNASSPTASFYSEVSSTGHSSYRQETEAEEIRRKEQEWFDQLLDDMVEAEDLLEDDYVDVSFREPSLLEERDTAAEDSTERLADSGWMEHKGSLWLTFVKRSTNISLSEQISLRIQPTQYLSCPPTVHL